MNNNVNYLFDIATGFWASKTLFSSIELGIFDCISNETKSAETISSELNLPIDSVNRLLTALCSLEIIKKDNIFYSNSPLAHKYLLKNSETYLGSTFQHFFNNVLYQLWGHLSNSLKSSHHQWHEAFGLPKGQNPFEVLYSDQNQLVTFMEAMNSLSKVCNEPLMENFDFSSYKCLLDLGSGLATLPISVVNKYPSIEAIAFDLPPVCSLTKEKISLSNLSERIEVVAGDMFANSLPNKADIISLGWILHDWNDQQCISILKNCFAALPSNGSILVLEKFINDALSGPKWPALLSLTILVFTSMGVERTSSHYSQLLAEAGFVDIKAVSLDGLRDFIIARKP